MRHALGSALLIAGFGAGALLSACATQQEEQAFGELCRFANREKPFLVAYYSRQAVLVTGDIEPAKWKDEQSTIPSALARPATPVYEQKRRKDCYNADEKYWYPCTEVVEVDLSKHGAIIRGMSLDRARADAVTFCNREVLKAVPQIDGQTLTSADYRCKLVAARECPIE